MSRYIEVDAFLENNKEFADREFEHPMYQATLRELVDEAPSIDIVRCKECSKRKKNRFCLEHKRYEKNDEGFCSYGERSSE